ncbi:hypothetical protein VCHA34P131_20071 [Vibrio chagasii]|nr:hypothetical protein VCHA34P131_20071 [Vibrio chagasii]CAH7368889.1 hypothetical protein VCHA38O206_60040 [Vibrio chagasii]CAH7421808.1 hypothetical protein VCHA54O482_30072 [Vibrio chagasii]
MYGKMPCITIQAKEICISDSLHQPIREQLGFYLIRANSR